MDIARISSEQPLVQPPVRQEEVFEANDDRNCCDYMWIIASVIGKIAYTILLSPFIVLKWLYWTVIDPSLDSVLSFGGPIRADFDYRKFRLTRGHFTAADIFNVPPADRAITLDLKPLLKELRDELSRQCDVEFQRRHSVQDNGEPYELPSQFVTNVQLTRDGDQLERVVNKAITKEDLARLKQQNFASPGYLPPSYHQSAEDEATNRINHTTTIIELYNYRTKISGYDVPALAQDVIRHLKIAFVARRAAWEEMPFGSDREHLMSEYYKDLQAALQRVEHIFGGCIHRQLPAMEDLYVDYVVRDPTFTRNHAANQSLKVRLQCITTEFRKTILENAMSDPNEAQHGSNTNKHMYARQYFGPNYGIPCQLSNAGHVGASGENLITGVPQKFRENYPINNICREIRDRLASGHDRYLVSTELTTDWLQARYPNCVADLELLDQLMTMEDNPINPKSPITRWSEDAILLFLEDQGEITYTGLGDHPLAKYREA